MQTNATAYKRPWQEPVPPLSSSVDVQVFFPSDDEDHGLVDVSWRGPLGRVGTVFNDRLDFVCVIFPFMNLFIRFM